jgi:hypothetical protein
LAEHKSDPRVVKKWEDARAKLAGYKAKLLKANTAEDRNKYQKLEAEALKECLNWYDKL